MAVLNILTRTTEKHFFSSLLVIRLCQG